MHTSTPSFDRATAVDSAVRLIGSVKTWIQAEALRQFYAVAGLEGVRRVVGFPDLHPGRGAPVGAAFETEDLIYPHLIGSDIGCGVALFKTDLIRRKARIDRWADLPFNLEHPWEGDQNEFLAEHDLE